MQRLAKHYRKLPLLYSPFLTLQHAKRRINTRRSLYKWDHCHQTFAPQRDTVCFLPLCHLEFIDYSSCSHCFDQSHQTPGNHLLPWTIEPIIASVWFLRWWSERAGWLSTEVILTFLRWNKIMGANQPRANRYLVLGRAARRDRRPQPPRLDLVCTSVGMEHWANIVLSNNIYKE